MGTLRADQLLVERSMAPSRSAAQRLIKAGAVSWRLGQGAWTLLTKAGEPITPDCEFAISNDDELRFVSRAGLKLEGALTHSGISAKGLNCLDIGSSTGGFSDCLLQGGAALVLGFDVGHGQLHARLQHEPRMINTEGVNARAMTRADFPARHASTKFQLAVVDVSFISLSLVLAPVVALLAPGATLVALVKPQFELGSKALTKLGHARDASAYEQLRQSLTLACGQAGAPLTAWFDSPIKGQDGNHEFFLVAKN
jgi:23S rRNA (cytidine1920-2'-O)/16S rRNA (cytidine1409-2'-O)-methyltransferase